MQRCRGQRWRALIQRQSHGPRTRSAPEASVGRVRFSAATKTWTSSASCIQQPCDTLPSYVEKDSSPCCASRPLDARQPDGGECQWTTSSRRHRSTRPACGSGRLRRFPAPDRIRRVPRRPHCPWTSRSCCGAAPGVVRRPAVWVWLPPERQRYSQAVSPTISAPASSTRETTAAPTSEVTVALNFALADDHPFSGTGGRCRRRSRNGEDATQYFPEVSRSLSAIWGGSYIADGEVCLLLSAER